MRKNRSISSVFELLSSVLICSVEGKRLQTHMLPMVLQVPQALLHIAFLFSCGSLSICDCLLTRLSDVAEEEGVRTCSEIKMVKGHHKQKMCTCTCTSSKCTKKFEYKRHNTMYRCFKSCDIHIFYTYSHTKECKGKGKGKEG